MRERESILERMEERVSRLTGWLAGRRHHDPPTADDLRTRLETIRLGLAKARRSIDAVAKEDLGRVRASLEALRNDYDVPPPQFALKGTELAALRRHFQTTDRLARVLSNLDDPGWEKAHEEYERSWAELQRAFEPEGDAAAP